ncbi:MAG: glycosyltransferase [Roseburia sp.]|nr:glycosyltransferase [Roseburia sp.]
MRIAMFTNNYKPYIGGVPVSIEHLAEALRARGHKVWVFAPSYGEGEEEPYVIRYPSFPFRVAGAPVPDVLTGVFLKKVRELEIDVIHVHHPALVGNVALHIRRKLGIPVVFTYHTRYMEYLHYIRGLESFEEHTGFLDWYLRRFCNRCDLLVAPTPGIRSYLYGKEVIKPVEVLPTGMPQDAFSPDQKIAAEIRQRYIGDADYLFCTVSRLAAEKNLIFQMQGLAHLGRLLKKKKRTFRHLFIGDGPEKENLMHLAEELGLSEHVVFVGNIENSEMKNYQAACDAFLFTSQSETQGIVLLEAMAAGNPVVALDASGVRDIVSDGENGFLTAGDAADWAGRVAALVEDEKRKRQMGENAVRTAMLYAEEEVARRAEQYYRKVCGKMSEEISQMVPVQRRGVV